MLLVAVGAYIGGCGAKPAAPSPTSSATMLDVRSSVDGDASVAIASDPDATAPVAVPDPDEKPLERVSLTRLGSLAKACSGLRAHSDSPVLRNGPGVSFTSVRTGCRVRPAAPIAPRALRGPSLVELSRTVSFPRHADVDSVAAALAFPLGNAEWLVAIEGAVGAEGMQSMADGDESGSVEVASVEEVDLSGTEVPELAFVLLVTDGAQKRRDLVVCDSKGAWCTKPSTLDWLPGLPANPYAARGPSWGSNEARSFVFRRHPRGVLVLTTGEPLLPNRLFPFAATP